MVDVKELLAKTLENMHLPLKVVRFKWVCSSSYAAGSRLIQNANPSNSSNPSAKPSGYTFLCWIQIISVGWVGAIYAENPESETTSIWTASAKGSTSNESVQGIALYIRSDLA